MPRRIGGAGYALVDLSETEYASKLVSLLRWKGFPLARVSDAQFGGGGYSRIGRWVVDGDGGGGGASGEDARLRVGAGGGFGGGSLGYLLVDSAWLKLYPLLTVGSVGSGYAVNPKTGDQPSYAFELAPTVSIGVGIELRLPITRRFSPLIGVRFGYRHMLQSYQVQENSAAEMPSRASRGLFFRVILGAGVKIR